MHTSNNFTSPGGDSTFANRQKLLFDRLKIAEKECIVNKDSSLSDIRGNDTRIDEPDRSYIPPRVRQKRRCETQQFCGKESIFKRPDAPAPHTKLRSIPDYHRNPHKWVMYSLEDVRNEDMTDLSNTQAAFSLFNELKARRAKRQLDEKEEENSHYEEEDKSASKLRKINCNIEYKKPEIRGHGSKETTVVVDNEQKPFFRSSKMVMPEYVVGQKIKKKITKKDQSVMDRSKQLKLDHLQEFDEEED